MASKEVAQTPAKAGAEQVTAKAGDKLKTVKPLVRVEHDGEVYEPGSDATFEIGGKPLQALLDVKAVEIVEDPSRAS